MPDLASITAIVKSVKAATEIAKFLKDSDLTVEKAEIKLQLADLISSLADARIETAEIQTILIEKDEQISNLTNKLKIKGSLVYEKPYYWIIDGNSKDGPFCQNCQDGKDKLIRLQQLGNAGYWNCLQCNNSVIDGDYQDKKNMDLSNLAL